MLKFAIVTAPLVRVMQGKQDHMEYQVLCAQQHEPKRT